MKLFYFILLLPVCLWSQSLYWIDYSFQSPRLCIASTIGEIVSTTNLAAGTTPQGIDCHSLTNNIYLVDLYYPDASIQQSSSSLSVNETASGFSVLRDVAIDEQNSKIYWTSSRAGTNCIGTCGLDGSNTITVIDFGTDDPGVRCIALDIKNNKMYWTEFSAGRIRSAPLDGSQITTVVENLSGPVGLDIDTSNGKLYWTETNGNKICCCNVDGSATQTLINSGLDRPHHLTIYSNETTMYWTEDGNAGSTVKSASLNGDNVQTLVTDVGHPGGIVFSPTETSELLVRVKIFLEGYYDTSTDQMHTALNDAGALPSTSPYTDNRSVSAIPAGVSDWVYIGINTNPDGSVVAGRSAFIRNDGVIVDDDGTSDVAISAGQGDYYLSIQHRNHLKLLSSTAHALSTESSSTSLFDFTTGSSQTYNSKGVRELKAGVWGAACGDINQDGVVTTMDYVIWYNKMNNATTGYTPADVDGNADVNSIDKEMWKTNALQGLESAFH